MKLRGREWFVAPNPALGWHGVEEPGLARRHVARIGDCSWQVIERGHTMGPAGYPAVLAEMLRQRGTGMTFSNYFAGMAADVTDSYLERLVPVESDAIILQFGAQHGMRRLFASTGPRTARLSMWANWRAGSLGGVVHRRMTGPALHRWGRPYWPGNADTVRDDDVHRVLSWLADHRPGVPCVMLSSHPVLRSGWVDPPLVERATEHYMRVARSHGVDVLDYRPAIRRELDSGRVLDRDVYGATGYDLRLAGHRVIAGALLDWLGTQWTNESDREARVSRV